MNVVIEPRCATRVILIDDHAVVREGLRALIEEQPGFEVVGEFGDGDAALAASRDLAPDVAVLDLKMPGPGPEAIIRGLRLACPPVNVLVFTSFPDATLLRATLNAGAIGFLLKDALTSDLIRALRGVARGEPWLHPSAQRQLLDTLRGHDDRSAALTPREWSVLKLLAEGLSNKAIARRLDLTEGTVKGYVSQIFAKLELPDRTQAALYALKNGLIDGE